MSVFFRMTLCAAAVLLAAGSVCAETPLEPPLERMRAFFEGVESRIPGSAGNRKVEDRLLERFAALGEIHGALSFRAPAFLPGETRVHVSGLPPIRAFPMHPALFRPGNFSSDSFTASLVYVRHGTPMDLSRVHGHELENSIVVLEYDSGTVWRHFMPFGVQGFLFLDTGPTLRSEALDKVFATEVNVPRFFVPATAAATLREALQAKAGVLEAEINAHPSRWENRLLRSPWVLIPGADPTLSREVVVVAAPLDANGIVPDLALGAQSGANLFLLLEMFESFRHAPPARSVLICAFNAHTQFHRGERMLAWYLTAPLSDIERFRDVLARDIREQEILVETYADLVLDGTQDEADEALLIALRRQTDFSSHRQIVLKDPMVNMARQDVNRIKSQQLALLNQKPPPADLARRQAELDRRRDEFVKVLILFNRAGIQSRLSDLSETERAILRNYVHRIVEDNRRNAELNRRDLLSSQANAAIRDAIAGLQSRLVLLLDMDFSSGSVGFATGDEPGRAIWPRSFGHNAARWMRTLTESGAPDHLFVDSLTNVGGLPQGHFVPVLSRGPQFFHIHGQTPAFSLANCFSARGAAFTPHDRWEALDVTHVEDLLQWTPRLFRKLLNDERITRPGELPPPTGIPGWAARIRTLAFDAFAPSAFPEFPVSEAAVLLYGVPNFEWVYPPIVAAEVINAYMAITDSRAVADFQGIQFFNWMNPLVTAAFQFDPEYRRVLQTIDAGDTHSRVTSVLLRNTEHVLAMFECEEHAIATRIDPSRIESAPIEVERYIILDAHLNSAPRKYGYTGMQSLLSNRRLIPTPGPAAVFIEPGFSFKLISEQKRLLVNPTVEQPEGLGYSALHPLGADIFSRAAMDMSRVTQARMREMRGVSDALAQRFLRHGDAMIETLSETRRARDWRAVLDAQYEALGSQVKAYRQTLAATNDMLKAVVFYMALMLPFCFFLQRLLFKTVRIERQMAAFMGLFVLVYLVFRLIHPAFRVAQAPEAIFVAFVMGALGLFVIYILKSRFEGEMQLLFRAHTAAEKAEVGFSTVSQQAMLIGVNNMKRRRVRTVLTSGTIVLVTFTMLAFTSVSRRMHPTLIRRSNAPLYNGLFYSWPGRTMDEDTLRVFRQIFEGRGRLFVRRWLLATGLDEGRPGAAAYYPMRLRGPSHRSVTLDAVLGMSVAEDGFLADLAGLTQGRFFSDDDAFEAILPASLAQALHITPHREASVRLYDADLRVVGILPDTVLRSLRDINGLPLLPIKAIAQEDVGEGADDSPPDERGVTFVNASEMILVPLETSRRLGARPFSVSVAFEDEIEIWPILERLLTIGSPKFYISRLRPFQAGSDGGREMEAGVYYVGEGYRTSIGGLARLLIPVLIAGTLIFNTMLGTVFERKHEIAIYNAIGLNPNQIGLFFIAEAFVYGVLGSIGGYLIGQVLSLTLHAMGWGDRIHLNFSSLSVVYVVLFTIAIVLLSTLYPARMATRAAVPSGKRKWSMPVLDGDRIHLDLPFIYQPNLLPGVMRYLEEYFDRFTEASIGDVIARLEHREAGRDAQGNPRYALRYDIALPPYDLGVTQKVTLQACHNDAVGAHRIRLKIQRESGQDTNWRTTNKPFLENLRQYLIHWRNLSADEHMDYVRQGEATFGLSRTPPAGEPT